MTRGLLPAAQKRRKTCANVKYGFISLGLNSSGKTNTKVLEIENRVVGGDEDITKDPHETSRTDDAAVRENLSKNKWTHVIG